MGDLFQRVKDIVKAQKSNFCSRSTWISLINTSKDPIPQDLEIQYINCNGETLKIPYREILNNSDYIPDCVKGGSPVTAANDKYGVIKVLTNYGITNCDTPPPPINVTVISCENGSSYIVQPPEAVINEGEVYLITFNRLPRGCYTIGTKVRGSEFVDKFGEYGAPFQTCDQCKRSQ